jgi:hypothetical protein
MRRAMRDLPYAFSAERMVIDYIEQFYKPSGPSLLGRTG